MKRNKKLEKIRKEAKKKNPLRIPFSFLDFYRHWHEDKKEYPHTYNTGLCNALPNWVLDSDLWQVVKLNRFRTEIDKRSDCTNVYFTEEYKDLIKEGHNTAFWGSGSKRKLAGKFTPLRQTIILLAACLNDEL